MTWTRHAAVLHWHLYWHDKMIHRGRFAGGA
jgi:hypothetical protein